VGCPYEGEIAPERVAYLAGLMKGIGVQHVGVADTIGVGTPCKVQRALEATLQHFGIDEVSGHFHDTYGQALSNTLAGLELGVWNFQSSVAGLGGCPYAKGATGNDSNVEGPRGATGPVGPTGPAGTGGENI
jgi:hydroxymethylglutaryl-CoA lyase